MTRRRVVGAFLVLFGVTLALLVRHETTERLDDVGPRLVSNRASTPLLVTGRSLSAGEVLTIEVVPSGEADRGSRPLIGPPANLEVALAQSDGAHAWTRLPPIDLPADRSEADLVLTLRSADGTRCAGGARLTVVNDRHFPDPIGLALAGGRACAISQTTDELACGGAGGVSRLSLASGPAAIASTRDGFLIGFDSAPELWQVDAGLFAHRSFPGPRGATGIAWDQTTGIAYVAEHVTNSLWAIDLNAGGRVLWKTPIDPGPGPVALAGERVAVGSKQTGQVQLVRASDGALLSTISPEPGTPIHGGRTQRFSSRIMGGLAVRSLAWSPKLDVLFVASAGPNIGPNPERMELAMNAGVTVVDLARARVRHHVGFGAGITEALALDGERDRLWASDVSLGLVRALDAGRLARGDESLAVESLPIPPPDGFPTILPRSELGVSGRAGVELHSGPKALALDPDGSLWVLDRFTGTLAHVRSDDDGALRFLDQVPLFDALTQPERRKGQVLFYADVGRTGVTCDGCHVDGHVGGVLFTKTRPIRIYRSTSLRGSRDTPPYFIPASEPTLESTAAFVGSRNRFHNPRLSPSEVRELALFAGEIPTPANPFVRDDGALPDVLALPDGSAGHPRLGADVFFARAACASCHPAPLFATDQSPATRGRHLDVRTPSHFPLSAQWQDPVRPEFPAPSLDGIWDLFPLFTTGTAGLGEDGGRLVVRTRFPLRAAVEQHGTAVQAMSDCERNDLLAFLMSL